ncbi:MAG: dihydroorotate dehydrogenase [Acidimicrobiia bacterium]|nr:dihydroorotate dehydrogenase [Acidimicrobiia bacterium]
MASPDLKTALGPLELRSPLIAASGTVGSVWEWAQVADTSPYGAAVAKSVAPVPWSGRPPPRLAPLPTGMLNGIGIQNPGIESWVAEMSERIPKLEVPVWGSAVGGDPAEFAVVSKGLESAGVSAVEVNLSCPNLDSGEMFSFDAGESGDVIGAVKSAVGIAVGAKLSPDTPDIAAVAGACYSAGADFVVLTNTARGFGVSISSRSAVLSGGVGGYSGPGLKPLSLRCVHEVASAFPGRPIVGCGGVTTGRDVVEYLMVGASAVAIGTAHLAEPKAGRRIRRELGHLMEVLGAGSVAELVGSLTR